MPARKLVAYAAPWLACIGLLVAWQVAAARRHDARLLELDAGHSPFITQPDELAAVLASLA